MIGVTGAMLPAAAVERSCLAWQESDAKLIQARRDKLVADYLRDWMPPFEWFGLRPYSQLGPTEDDAIRALKEDSKDFFGNAWYWSAERGSSVRRRVEVMLKLAQFALAASPGAWINVSGDDIAIVADYLVVVKETPCGQ